MVKVYLLSFRCFSHLLSLSVIPKLSFTRCSYRALLFVNFFSDCVHISAVLITSLRARPKQEGDPQDEIDLI